MKRIEAIIRHHLLDDVKDQLAASGITGMTVSEARGFGRQRGHKETYRGTEYSVDFISKVCLEVIVPERMLRDVVNTIIRAARTGNIGDGKILITDLEEVIRIRTGETGEQAI